MVLFIAGSSHTGKTLLAQRLMERHHYPYLSIDHLKMGLIRSGNIDLTPEDDDALLEYLWPIVREIAKTAIENEQNLIIEGCYIPFDWKNDFDTEYLEHIRYVCLVMTERYISEHFDDILRHASEIEHRLCDDYPKEELLAENAKNLAMCRKYGYDVILIDREYAVDYELL